jgi:hypothetical protein
MRIHRLAGLLALCLLLQPAARNLTAGDSFAVEYSTRLKASSRADLERYLKTPFTAGAAHPAGTSNCAQMLARQGRQQYNQGTDRELQALRSTMAECLVLRELQRAIPARRSYMRDLVWDERVLSTLPVELAISVSDEEKRAIRDAASRGKTWADFDPSISARTSGADRIMVTGKGFSEQLILWGRGDFNRDGTEDLLVQSLDTLTEGTYRNTRLFVLTRRTTGGRFAVVRSLL